MNKDWFVIHLAHYRCNYFLPLGCFNASKYLNFSHAYKGIKDDETQAVEQAADEVGVPLPDIKQALQRKAIEKEMEKLEEEQEASKVKIKRSDKEAFAKVRQRTQK